MEYTPTLNPKAEDTCTLYPPDTAGRIMSSDFTRLKGNLKISEAFQRLRASDQKFETIYYCYVTDEKNVLQGIISVRDIFAAQDEQLVKDVMEDSVVYVDAFEDQEDVARLFDRYDFLAVPVVDEDRHLLGVVTVDDALDVMHEEVAEDLTKMASVVPSRDKKDYLDTSVWEHARSRIVWLIILTLSGLINEGILNSFEPVFLSLPILVSYIPMLTDTGGNAGSQSSAIVIRSLALGEISFGDTLSVIWKELRIGFLCGLAMAVVNMARIIIFEGQAFLVALTVSLTLVGVAMIAKILGATLPMLAEKLKLDSAVMAGPLIATISDGISLLIYFLIASLIIL